MTHTVVSDKDDLWTGPVLSLLERDMLNPEVNLDPRLFCVLVRSQVGPLKVSLTGYGAILRAALPAKQQRNTETHCHDERGSFSQRPKGL